MSIPYPQKSFSLDVPVTSSPSTSSKILSHPALAPAVGLYTRFAEWRASLGLPSPGTMENLTKDVKSTQLTNFMFDGARADLTKALSLNPTFSVTHSFALGSQSQDPTYSFNAAFMSPKTFIQGMIDHEGNLSGRFHQSWSPNLASKIQLQLGSQPDRSMIQLEQDYTGSDHSVNLKAINPSPVDGTGLYFGSYLQSLTKNIALGVESLWQRMPDGEDLNTSYILKYTSTKQDWVATTNIQPQGMVNATYWHKLSEKLDVAAELQLLATPQKRDAVGTIAAKWELRMAAFRAQLDSTGKVSALLEQRFAPSFAFLVSGEIDHFKGSAKVGVGVMVESSSLTPEEMGMGPQICPEDVGPAWLQIINQRGSLLAYSNKNGLGSRPHQLAHMHSVDLAPNYYKVLGVPQTATFMEIKQTYRGLLLKHHPDKTTSSKSAPGIDIDLLKRAYEILSDPKSREEYDSLLRNIIPHGGPRAHSTPRPAQVVSIDLWDEVEGDVEMTWTYPCRCGSQYVLREGDMENDVHLVPCEGCSESLYVGYELQEEP